MSEELKPCPFCGGEALLAGPRPHEGFTVIVIECEECPALVYANSTMEVIEYWNTRKEPKP